MKKYNKAFSLIEVIIASTILTITVFGVYKLIGENTKLINNSDNLVQLNSLFPSLEECIDYIGFDSFSGSSQKNYDFNFGTTGTGCLTGTTNPVKIDNIEYKINGEITNSGSNFIDWKLTIFANGVGKSIKTFKQAN